ncbi:MAG: site-specific integrase [Acholeplasmatales bacterium]|nr:site-specific integrase [Acholeplasmatales bacterium]
MEQITTRMMVEEYLNSRRVNLKAYSFSIISNILNKHFLNYFEKLNLNGLKPKDINDYYLSLASLQLKPKTKNNIISTIMVFINWLDIMEYLCPSIKRKFKQIIKAFPLTESPKSDYLSLEEIKILFSSMNIKSFEDRREKLMIQVLLFSGLRKSELRALTFNDIDIKNSCIYVNKQLQSISINGKLNEVLVEYTKTNKNRVINIPKWMIEEIEKYRKKYIKEKNYNDVIFPYKYVRINRILNKHLTNAGLRHVKIHDLRHSYCTMLYDNGANSKFVQRQLGHASEKTSRDIYEHLTSKMMENGIDIINNLI